MSSVLTKCRPQHRLINLDALYISLFLQLVSLFVGFGGWGVYLNTAKTPKLRKDTQRRAKTGKDAQRHTKTCKCNKKKSFEVDKDTQRRTKTRKNLRVFDVFACLCASLRVFVRLCVSLRSLGVFVVFR